MNTQLRFSCALIVASILSACGGGGGGGEDKCESYCESSCQKAAACGFFHPADTGDCIDACDNGGDSTEDECSSTQAVVSGLSCDEFARFLGLAKTVADPDNSASELGAMFGSMP